MRALDGRNDAQPDLSVREVRAADRFMVCSDGLSGVVSESTISEELAFGQPSEAALRLIALAKKAGGPDNITVVIADVVDADDRPATQALVVGAAGEPELAQRAADIVDSSPAGKARAQLGENALKEESQRAKERFEADEDFENSARRQRWIRRGAITALVALLIIALGVVCIQWIGRQFYVASNGTNVAIFQGVNQHIAWISLAKPVTSTDIATQSLPEQSRFQVEQGISAKNLEDAQRVVDRLHGDASSCTIANPPAGCPSSQPGSGLPIPAPTVSPRLATPGTTP